SLGHRPGVGCGELHGEIDDDAGYRDAAPDAQNEQPVEEPKEDAAERQRLALAASALGLWLAPIAPRAGDGLVLGVDGVEAAHLRLDPAAASGLAGLGGGLAAASARLFGRRTDTVVRR